MDYEKLKNWSFEPVVKEYTQEDTIHFARGFGAGLPGPLQQEDVRFTQAESLQALPALAVALADGEFWQQDPEAGLQWQKIVHAEESITVHRPLQSAGKLVVTRWIDEIYDRGAERGALMLEREVLSDEQGASVATIDVRTIALADGGFGGKKEPHQERTAIPERTPDAVLELATPLDDGAIFRLPAVFDVASNAAPGSPKTSMLRGLCSFGIACRAALKLACNNQPERLRTLSVRYVGPMYTEEKVRVELWNLDPGSAVFRMWAVERDALILNNCVIRFDS